VRKKRKNLVQEEEDNLIENEIQRFSLEDMELEVDIEKIFPTIELPKNMAQQNSLLEVIGNETFSEEESFTFQSVVFYKYSKNLIVERVTRRIKRECLTQRSTWRICDCPKFPKSIGKSGMRLTTLLMV
jgi:hypothetical protein